MTDSSEKPSAGGPELSRRLRAFEEAFDVLNREFFESALSKSVITIAPTPGAYGHFSSSSSSSRRAPWTSPLATCAASAAPGAIRATPRPARRRAPGSTHAPNAG